MICLFGGTFDPVHVLGGDRRAQLGQLAADGRDALAPGAGLLLEQRHVLVGGGVQDDLDPLVGDHPLHAVAVGHRAEPGATVAQRWRMLELACADDPRLVADDLEVRRAERLVAAQSAQIGIAESDLYPRLALNGFYAPFAIAATGAPEEEVRRQASRSIRSIRPSLASHSAQSSA